jgi:uncharacterized membrane-anchored protein
VWDTGVILVVVAVEGVALAAELGGTTGLEEWEGRVVDLETIAAAAAATVVVVAEMLVPMVG